MCAKTIFWSIENCMQVLCFQLLFVRVHADVYLQKYKRDFDEFHKFKVMVGKITLPSWCCCVSLCARYKVFRNPGEPKLFSLNAWLTLYAKVNTNKYIANWSKLIMIVILFIRWRISRCARSFGHLHSHSLCRAFDAYKKGKQMAWMFFFFFGWLLSLIALWLHIKSLTWPYNVI